MPYRWFARLEQPDNQQLFRNTEHMSMLGYLPMDSSRNNPAALPIGFAMSRADSEEGAWMGFTCAACHVNEIDYQGNKMLIDGAPTLGNFVGFFDRVVASLNNTLMPLPTSKMRVRLLLWGGSATRMFPPLRFLILFSGELTNPMSFSGMVRPLMNPGS